jgi:hypothetical protein
MKVCNRFSAAPEQLDECCSCLSYKSLFIVDLFAKMAVMIAISISAICGSCFSK